MSVFDRLVVSGEPVKIPPPTDGIDATRPFPRSYLRFVERFGYGLTCGLFRIHVPLGHEFPDSVYVRESGIKWALEATLRPDDPSYDFLYEPDGSRALIPGLVGFATSENGESLFWDTRAPADEYPIYLSGRGTGIRYGGQTLEDFVERITNATTVKSVMKFASEPLPLTFECSTSPHIRPYLEGR